MQQNRRTKFRDHISSPLLRKSLPPPLFDQGQKNCARNIIVFYSGKWMKDVRVRLSITCFFPRKLSQFSASVFLYGSWHFFCLHWRKTRAFSRGITNQFWKLPCYFLQKLHFFLFLPKPSKVEMWQFFGQNFALHFFAELIKIYLSHTKVRFLVCVFRRSHHD